MHPLNRPMPVPRLQSARLPCAALLLVLAVACERDTPLAPDPTPLPPLVATTWHAHATEGQALPANVAHWLEDGVLVQDFLDSARVEIRADGTWERRLWMSRFRSVLFDSPVVELETGTWSATDSGYLFAAEFGARQFSIAAMTPGAAVNFPLRGVPGGSILATLRTEAAPPAVTGAFEILTVLDQPVPATMYVFNDVAMEGRVVSIHLIVDSARVDLWSNGTYTHRIHYSEWEGPNHGAPSALRYQWNFHDYGFFTRGPGAAIEFHSNWLENHQFAGTVDPADGMDLQHGLGHGDPPVPVHYTRR